MTELKTLKDIREKAIKDICKNIKAEPEDLCSFGPLGMMSVKVLVTTFLRDDLRKVAIKWIKNWLSKIDQPIKWKINPNYQFGVENIKDLNDANKYRCASIGVFVNFFSITRGDLK